LTIGGKVILGPDDLHADPAAVLRYADVRNINFRPSVAGANITPRAAANQGEPWDRVMLGLGFYAHVTEIDDRLVNIEYWSLFAFNKSTALSSLNHSGDITAFQVVYDRLQDKLVRIAFGIHGSVIEAFDLERASIQARVLAGKDPTNNSVFVSADQYIVPLSDKFQDASVSLFTYWPSDPIVYLVRDPQTGRAEHPAVFVEWGAHEPWPNPTGSVTFAPKHTGDGVSFLPGSVHLFAPQDDPFRYFGGQFGDPVGLLRHRFWLPETGIYIPEDLRNDRDPYTSLGSLSWPPAVPPATCSLTPPFSDENLDGGSCPGTLRGIKCEGSYCDNLTLECCSLPAVSANPGTGYWSDFFSEENDGQHICAEGRYVQAIRCSGRYCDNLSLRCESKGAVNGSCRWTGFFSEEDPIGECDASEVVAGVKCSGRFCDSLSLYCCRP
jgi:hypothetical protein